MGRVHQAQDQPSMALPPFRSVRLQHLRRTMKAKTDPAGHVLVAKCIVAWGLRNRMHL